MDISFLRIDYMSSSVSARELENILIRTRALVAEMETILVHKRELESKYERVHSKQIEIHNWYLQQEG